MKSKNYKFIVDEQKWARGKGGGQLLNEQGDMCILGFYARSLGIKEKYLLHMGGPHGSTNLGAKWPKWCMSKYNASKIASTNDDYISDDVRKDALKILFGKHNIEIEFINEKENITG